MATATLELPHTLHDTLLPRANTRQAADVSDPAKFLTIENVPVFAEHETVTKKGRQLRFTRHELQLVADCCNRRITETGDYAAICIGHLPDASELASNGTLPLVGLAGPFRVGLIGEQDPRYCILADFHLLRGGTTWDGCELSAEAAMERFPRRSPELWVEAEYSSMFLDPICLLGAECPRLDMGIVYSAPRDDVERYSIHRRADGTEVERYCAAGPAAGNVFLPSTNSKKKYTAEPTNDTHEPPEATPMAANLSPEDIQEIVSALMQTEQMQWVSQQMTANPGPEAAPTAPLDVPPAADPVAPPPEAASPEPTAAPPAPAPAVEPPPPSPSDAAPVVPPAPAGPDEPEKVKEAAACGGVNAVKYSRQQAELDDMRRQLAVLTEQLAVARKDIAVANEAKTDTERYSRLSQVRRVRKFDLDREFERCRYSKMDAQQFEDHLTGINENYLPIPLDTSLPTPDMPVMDSPQRPGAGAEKANYSKEQHDKALAVGKRLRAKGDATPYKDILQGVVEGKYDA